MRTRWFGESWGAPVCEDPYHVETPTTRCMGCQQFIEPTERGVVTAFVGNADPRLIEYVYTIEINLRIIDVVAYHVDCFTFGILGPDAAAPSRRNPSTDPFPVVGADPGIEVGGFESRKPPENELGYELPSIELLRIDDGGEDV